ncbi:hypothetical protein Hanom_Chr04g00280811 [Helianthus anomalus]
MNCSLNVRFVYSPTENVFMFLFFFIRAKEVGEGKQISLLTFNTINTSFVYSTTITLINFTHLSVLNKHGIAETKVFPVKYVY